MMHIGVFTCSRADYGILKKIIFKIKNHKKLKLNLFVCGSHLSKFYGRTVNEIKKDFPNSLIECPNVSFSNNEINVAASYVKLASILKKKINKKKIRLMVILGDRYELMPLAQLCLIEDIKIAHIHGGETTEGAIDNNIRNSISMLSDYHFVTTNKAEKKLKKFGIDSKRIFLIGSPSVEQINENLRSKKYLQKKYNFKFFKKNALVSFHPETKNIEQLDKNLEILLQSIENFRDIQFIFTAPGADKKSKYIKSKIKNFVKNNNNTLYYDSFGNVDFLSFLKSVDFIIGNSSSAIIEAPILKTISINIGTRQKGREFADSIIDLDYNKKKIFQSINDIYKKKLSKTFSFNSPYYIKKKPSLEFMKNLEKILKI